MMHADEPGAVLVTAPPEDAGGDRQRAWTAAYAGFAGACAVASASAAARLWSAGDTALAVMLAVMALHFGLACFALVNGVPGLRGRVHEAGSAACVAQLRHEYDQRLEHAGAEGALVAEIEDVERHLTALKVRLEAGRGPAHGLGCPCVVCDEFG